MSCIIFITFLAIFSTMVHPRDLFTDSLNGSDTDNNCTDQASPCQTISHAVNNAIEGDVVRVMPTSVYSVQGVNLTVSISMISTTGEKAVFDAGGGKRLFFIDVEGGQTIRFNKIEFRNGFDVLRGGCMCAFGIGPDITSLEVEDCVFDNCQAGVSGGGEPVFCA